jgi:hypothetical protein
MDSSSADQRVIGMQMQGNNRPLRLRMLFRVMKVKRPILRFRCLNDSDIKAVVGMQKISVVGERKIMLRQILGFYYLVVGSEKTVDHKSLGQVAVLLQCPLGGQLTSPDESLHIDSDDDEEDQTRVRAVGGAGDREVKEDRKVSERAVMTSVDSDEKSSVVWLKKSVDLPLDKTCRWTETPQEVSKAQWIKDLDYSRRVEWSSGDLCGVRGNLLGVYRAACLTCNRLYHWNTCG